MIFSVRPTERDCQIAMAAMTNGIRRFMLWLVAELAHIIKEIAVSTAAMEISGPCNRNPNISAKIGETT